MGSRVTAARAGGLTGQCLIGPLAARAESLRALAYSDAQSFPALFDSAASGPLARYSVLAAWPRGALWQDEGGSLHACGDLAGLAPRAGQGFLSALERALQLAGAGPPAEQGEPALPFKGGWVVFLGYEQAAEVEPHLVLPTPQAGTGPRAFALRVPVGLIYDHREGCAWIVAEPGAQPQAQALHERLRSTERLHPAVSRSGRMPRVRELQEEPPECFERRVRRAHAYIRAGDIYQANLSRPWRARIEADEPAVAALYERLRAANPAPFACLARFQGLTLLCSSPERLVESRAGRVHTRPIAGTRPRSRALARERGEKAALIASPKERAEHVMLIDLERNDLGRICRGGTVHVEELMTLESYAHVHHIVSCVSGSLREDAAPTDVLRAVFPGGTITGCPKVRCMQIIAELEAQARGPYTGSFGYINHDGSMDFNILIRTISIAAGRLEFRAGAGIVADSRWQRELQETRAKARGLLAALELT